jgi:predicted DNA-binding antitoxin AbrB/MazE fold protein
MKKRPAIPGGTMLKTVRATYRAGTLALAEPLPFSDGETVDVTVTAPSDTEAAAEAIRATSGAWADLLDCEAFERGLYERRHQRRSPVHL